MSPNGDPPSKLSRRRFVAASGAVLATGATVSFPAIAKSNRPIITHGIQSGDVTHDAAVLWSRVDRPSRMLVELGATESFRNPRRIAGPAALEVGDYTAKLVVDGLPPGQDIFYRVRFISLDDHKATSEPMVGRFRTAPSDYRDVRLLWTGDTAGQGWGINLDWGGMKGYERMRAEDPDLLVQSGDLIYADVPISAEKPLPNGGIWKNLTTPAKSKVAETLREFRGNYQYNLLDENVRRFNAEVAVCAQWDDHETVDNWYPNEILGDARYSVRSVALLAARANHAFLEYTPTRIQPTEPQRIYRKIPYGPRADLFLLDLRSYRADNGPNRQSTRGPDTTFLGGDQIAWLERELRASRATWKIIASDMPIGLIVYDDWRYKTSFDNAANGDGPVLGREHDFAQILKFIHDNRVTNTVWLTADVHYTAAHFYDPSRAVFQQFSPFWEFVSGPINAGTFGPGEMDNTFGPQVMFSKSSDGRPNLPPSEGLQFYGRVDIEGATGLMTVSLKNIAGTTLFRQVLEPSL